MNHAYNITKFNVIEVHTPCAIWNKYMYYTPKPKVYIHENKQSTEEEKKIVS